MYRYVIAFLLSIWLALQLSPASAACEIFRDEFGIGVTITEAGGTANPANATSGGSIFTSAGSSFPATVSDVLWSSTDALDNDGLLDTGRYHDNSVAPGYAWQPDLSVIVKTPFSGLLVSS